jgi:hypothetical protein
MQGHITFRRPGLRIENRRTAKQEAWCHPAYLQLVKNPDATRQGSDETLAGEEIWLSTGAMREALPDWHPRRRARLHVSASDWPNIVLRCRWLVGSSKASK